MRSNPSTGHNILDLLVVDADRGLFSLNVCDLFSNLCLARRQQQVSLAHFLLKFSLKCNQRIQMCHHLLPLQRNCVYVIVQFG